jgi:sugar lactone lactonase YvrE
MNEIEAHRVNIASTQRSALGEGPVWDAERKSLCWVDILGGKIHILDISENQHRSIDVGEMIGCIGIRRDGNFIAGLKSGIAFVNRDNSLITQILNPEIHLATNRFNDGKCDPAGRLWVGSMELSEKTGAGNLYMVDEDLQWTKKIEGVTISNGLAWTSDHRTFYYIDTPTRQVAAFDFDVTTGEISNKRIAIEIPASDGFPDGMTIDADDNLWIAHWDGWQVSRWDPRKGEKLLTVRLPAARITSCAFGGDALRDLYITSASTGLTEEQLKEQPDAGMLFVLKDSGYQGVRSTYFNYP